MAKIYVKSHKEPFDVPLHLAEKLKRDWLDDDISREEKITFSYFVGTLGDIKSFDLRSDGGTVDNYKDIPEIILTPEEKERADKIRKEIGQMTASWKKIK